MATEKLIAYGALSTALTAADDARLDALSGAATATVAAAGANDAAILATSAAGITPVADLTSVPVSSGLYRTLDTGYVYERPAGGGDPVRRPALEAAAKAAVEAAQAAASGAVDRLDGQAESFITLADFPRLAGETDDAPRIQRMLTQAATLGLSARGVAGNYQMASRISVPAATLAYSIDLSGMTMDFAQVTDYNGGPMVQVYNPPRGSVLRLGSIGDSAVPMPSADIVKRLAPPPSDSSWGALAGKKLGPHWRSDSDHAVQIYGGISFSLHVDVYASRAMGVVLEGCSDVWATGTTGRTLADGTHMYGLCSRIRWSMTAIDCGDDAFPVVSKNTDSGLTNHIYYINCMAIRCGRGFVTGGGEYIFRTNCTALDCMDQGFLEYADVGVPDVMAIVRHIRNTNCYAVSNGQRNPDALTHGENSSSGFHVSYTTGGEEQDIIYDNCHAFNNYGCGIKTDGNGITVRGFMSYGNRMSDSIRGSSTTIDGGEWEQMDIREGNVRLLNAPRFRKNGRTLSYALGITGDGKLGVQLIGVDFGTEWTAPVASDGMLVGALVRNCIGLNIGILPPAGSAAIANTPALPGSGAGWLKNTTAFDVQVLVQGGEVAGMNIRTPQGAVLDMGNVRTFRLPRGWEVQPYWTVQPSAWFWAID